MEAYFEARELRPPSQREQTLLASLRELVEYSRRQSPYYGQTLAAVDITSLTSRAALADLPLLRKSDLSALQEVSGPLGGIAAESAQIDRLFLSPGPICEPEHCTDDWWRMGRAFHAAGFRPGMKVQNCLSYHLSPGGFILDSGARACGCSVIPAGPGQTELQLELNARLKPEGYCGTPSFLAILLDRAEASQQPLSFRVALVTGEALPASLRARFEAAGIRVRQAYATADVGLIAYETEPDAGLVVDEDLLLEVVRPGSGQPVAEGEIGEVVVTSVNPDYPLVRFATGDLSSVMIEPSPCGRTNMRIRGWQGRADQSTKVKGLFVHPGQIEQLRNRIPGLARIRAVITQSEGQDSLTLLCEPEQLPTVTEEEVVAQARALLRLGTSACWVAAGVLPRDGVVIEDTRPTP
ncbi:phenylacetate--CoA ligase family protein [Ferrimonas balearica]|uniref:phenylacetate--CoA ligase family protein n=1 Tax=Ferrimonas balearica TaxID=44012 RepID=UPI001C999088|nr:AMP-binding protein [Ferrimonas balearica]MBY5921724.1 AMP-binding protein [Ferrimonas balearica]MBY5994936.1 AMP-binding protein [Ferrimonas balearica]